LKSVLDVLRSGAAFLERKGVESARLNMEHLLAHVLGLKRLELYLQFDRPLGEAELQPLRGLVERRAAGAPLQHLLGTIEFGGHVFKCDARALIPRPETEELVAQILARLKSSHPDGPLRILDVGCGSGVIGLSLALALEGAEVTLADISPDALELARENAEALGLSPPAVRFWHGDLFGCVDRGSSFGVIAANLPYVPSTEIPYLSREVRNDPVVALDGGAGGTAVIERLIAEAPAFLEPAGLIALEIGDGQAASVVELMRNAGCADIEVVRDAAGHERMVFARRGDS
jgi:release factor glutamine methyltransferase